jgi:hypothetical protein
MFVELIFFKTKPGVSDAAVKESAGRIQKLAAQMNSPFELELLRTEDGEWVEIVHWPSQAEAQRVEQAVLSMPEAREAMAVMDETSIRMVFLHPIESR